MEYTQKLERAAFEIVADAWRKAWEEDGDICKTLMAALRSPEARAALYAQANELGIDDAGLWRFADGIVTNAEDDLLAKCSNVKTGRYLASVSPQMVGSLMSDYNRQAAEIARLTEALGAHEKSDGENLRAQTAATDAVVAERARYEERIAAMGDRLREARGLLEECGFSAYARRSDYWAVRGAWLAQSDTQEVGE